MIAQSKECGGSGPPLLSPQRGGSRSNPNQRMLIPSYITMTQPSEPPRSPFKVQVMSTITSAEKQQQQQQCAFPCNISRAFICIYTPVDFTCMCADNPAFCNRFLCFRGIWSDDLLQYWAPFCRLVLYFAR